MNEKEKVHHVFWTGGQDSTFRVLQVLSTTGKTVQPHYLIRQDESSGHEIDTMNNIWRAALRKYPEWRSRFLPTNYINVDLIPCYADIDQSVEDLRRTMRVDESHRLMASYCRMAGIGEMDVFHEPGLPDPGSNHTAPVYFEAQFPFESFRSPLGEMTKRSSYLFAKEHGWEDILNMIWFCIQPMKKVIPCGMCGPCTDAVRNGMGFRLPLKSRVKARILIPFRAYYRRNYLKHNTSWFFRLIKQKLEPRM